jgi:hypothetical protein
MPLLYQAFFLLGKLPEYPTQLSPQFSVESLSAILRDEHHVIFAIPLRMG